MRIAFYHNILWSKYKGAIFSRLYALCEERGVEAQFVQIAETATEYARLGGVDLSYHNYPFRLLMSGDYAKASLIRRIWVTAKDLLTHRCDLVVLPGYDLVEYWVMIVLCMLLRRKRAVFCDATQLDRERVRVKEIAKRLFFTHCDGVFCYGRLSKEYVSNYGVSAARIFFNCQAAALPHGYNPDLVRAAYRAKTIEQAADALEDPHFLFLGRLAPEKGVHDLVEAFRLVYRKQGSGHLSLVGAGPLEGALRAHIESVGLNGVVTLLGARGLLEVEPLFYRSVALVLPSNSEPWGLVVNEALSYGCPVIVSDRCGCVPELVIDGISGYSFSSGSIEGLAAAMLECLSLSKDRISTVENCLTLMSSFTPEKAAAEILRGCEAIAEGRV